MHVPSVKSYIEFRHDVLAAYDRTNPPDSSGERNTGQLAAWLLHAHCELLERYALYQELVKDNKEDC